MWNICRTCMSKKDELISIFDQGKSPKINTMLMAITSLEFVPNNLLPSQICVTCLETIEITYNFKEQVIRCNNALLKQAQISNMPAAQQVKEEQDEKMEEEDYFYEQEELVTIVDSNTELSTENVTSNVAHAELKSSKPELITVNNNTYVPSSEWDVNSLNFELPLKREPLDDLSGESSTDNIRGVDFHFKDTCIKSEEIDVEDHGVQFEDNLGITPQRIMSKIKADGEFCSEDDSSLTWIHISTGNFEGSLDVQQTSEEIVEVSRKAAEGLKRHIGVSKSHLCEVCGKTLLSRSHLMVHMKSHSQEKPFKCQLCNTGFVHNSDLKRHIRLHTGETTPKPHKCEICGKAYDRRSHLEVHLRRHTGEKPFSCPHCNVRYSQVGDLKRHISSHSSEATAKLHKCEVCGKTFDRPSKVRRHMKSNAHKNP